jgi:anti-sigma-K factor RskA
MNLINNPELLDRLASHYALGSLRGGARRRFESLAREHASVRSAALVWQTRLASVNELQAQATPSPVVWTRIDNLVRGELDAAAMQSRKQATATETKAIVGWWQGLALWRGLAAAGALATVMAIVTGVNLKSQMGGEIGRLQAQLLATPQIEYVAVLADDKSAASMLVTFDPKNKKLVLQRVGGYQEAGDRSLQLWALPPSGGPRSLGVLGGDKLLQLTANDGDIRAVPTLAISLEPKGGVPSAGGPTGPVLFTGTVIHKML